MGSAGVDYLAQVAAFPHPDEKLRTERLEVQGGGNCGNALTAASRLGLSPTILTKIGGDSVGDGIIAEFQRDGVDTFTILRAQGSPSPFTYIIVDRRGGTRTCIHTPGEPLQPEEMTPQLVQNALRGAALVYFDGRLTEAALVLAQAARAAGIPVLVEAERLRPGLELLLAEADYVVSSAHFPGDWTGHQEVGDAVVEMLSRLPRARWLITTLGKRGSVLLERAEPHSGAAPQEVEANYLIERLFNRAEEGQKEAGPGEVACVSGTGVEVRQGSLAHEPACRLVTSSSAGAAAARAVAAAERAAVANADGSNPAAYMGASSGDRAAVVAAVTVGQAAGLPADAVLDTTGAGDAFIGSVLYCLATGLPVRHALQLGAVVAACKCTALGARPGLPRRNQLTPGLLGPKMSAPVSSIQKPF